MLMNRMEEGVGNICYLSLPFVVGVGILESLFHDVLLWQKNKQVIKCPSGVMFVLFIPKET